ncbi:hypothetical protein [Bdellovibrio sp. NC01]|nr:hypothetical protein [Bdellovibrio sp. NC01]
MEQQTKNSSKTAPPEGSKDARGIIILGVIIVLLIAFRILIYPHFE